MIVRIRYSCCPGVIGIKDYFHEMNWTALIIFIVYNLYLLGIEWGAAIIGNRNRHKSWPQAYKRLVILCWATAVLETFNFGTVLSKHEPTAVYNVWAYVETGVFIYIQSCELANTFMYAGTIACFITLRKNYSHV